MAELAKIRELAAADAWTKMLRNAEAGAHPNLKGIADLLERSGGVVPAKALPYVLGRLRETIKPPRGRPQHSQHERRWIQEVEAARARILKADYRRRLKAYQRLRRRIDTAHLKPANRRTLRTTPPHQLALRRLHERFGIGRETLRKIIRTRV